MNLDSLLLRLFLNDSSLYNKYQRYLKPSGVYSKLYRSLEVLLKDGVASHSPEQLALTYHSCYPIVSKGEAEAIESLLASLVGLKVSETEASELLRSLHQRYVSQEIALAAVAVAAGESEFETLEQKLEEIKNASLDRDEGSPFVSDDIVALTERIEVSPPFEFRLKTLNSILGGLHRRTFGFIYARPEIGKTQLVVSEATFLARQVPNCVLWINNEEAGTALITRCYQAALRKTSDELFRNAAEAKRAYQEATGGKIRIYDRPESGFREIEALVRDVRPDVIFIDQLDKVRGFKAERYDLEQKAKYQWARELAKRYDCAVIGVCQAGGSAEGKRYLDMNDVDSSHTAKQGEADWMFGLGRSDKVGDEDKRYISVSKNKLPPTPKMVSGMRHAKIPIISVPEYQLYEDAFNVS